MKMPEAIIKINTTTVFVIDLQSPATSWTQANQSRKEDDSNLHLHVKQLHF
jgi:hypothetical protein